MQRRLNRDHYAKIQNRLLSAMAAARNCPACRTCNRQAVDCHKADTDRSHGNECGRDPKTISCHGRYLKDIVWRSLHLSATTHCIRQLTSNEETPASDQTCWRFHWFDSSGIDYFFSSVSMTLTTSAASGFVLVPKRLTTEPSLLITNFSKFHLMSSLLSA